MVSPRTPQIQKRYGPSEGRSTDMLVQQRRMFEGGNTNNVEGEVFNFLNSSNSKRRGVIGNDGDGWQDEGAVGEEVFLQRALAAVKAASQRGDGVVEMGEREWQAWKLHESIEREVEKRVVEREIEREVQRQRDMARAEELQRELDELRQSGALDPPTRGEPGFMVDQTFTGLGGSQSLYSSNSSSSSSLARPGRQQRFMPDSTDSLYAQGLRPTPNRESSYSPSSFRGQQASPAHSPSYFPSTKSSPTPSTVPRRSGSRSSSLTRDSKHTRKPSNSTPTGAELAPGGSYYPGTHPSIPSSSNKRSKGGRESDGEDVYSSASAQLKNAQRRRRI
ncbi:hypothetical protein DFP73DRAFT_341062 [Morchella snyderi]|nr:hypothetical protein DFP73DRAFT_341062 [Morchella snyderi]